MSVSSDWTFNVISRAGIIGSTHWRNPRGGNLVILTKADQLVGPHCALLQFREAFPEWYKAKKKNNKMLQTTWESHHIVEEQDIKILRSHGIAIPDYSYCPAVLLPKMAHRNRINRLLGRGKDRSFADINTYREAYKEIGDYTGAGAGAICEELLAVCKIILMV